uniref:Uncharacterized protein n=1 Tax=Rhizophora mucronata TaxID=61149 RepID=A0A2P2L9P5_RHIMU
MQMEHKMKMKVIPSLQNVTHRTIALNKDYKLYISPAQKVAPKLSNETFTSQGIDQT